MTQPPLPPSALVAAGMIAGSLAFMIGAEPMPRLKPRLKFRRPWARPASPNGERWKYVILPRRTPKGWKALCWLRRIPRGSYWHG